MSLGRQIVLYSFVAFDIGSVILLCMTDLSWGVFYNYIKNHLNTMLNKKKPPSEDEKAQMGEPVKYLGKHRERLANSEMVIMQKLQLTLSADEFNSQRSGTILY